MCWEHMHNFIPRKKDSVTDSRCYELSSHEKDSLNQIEEYMLQGYDDPSIFRGHADYLLHMMERISGILECERSVGAPTESLELEYNRIKDMHSKIMKIQIIQ